MDNRTKQIKKILDKNNLLFSQAEKIKSDASNRKYLRLFTGKNTKILMDANPETNESIESFIYFTNFLRDHNFSAPKIYDSDIKNGLLLIEDLGTNNFVNTIQNQPDVEDKIYKEAVNQLVRMQLVKTPKLAKPYTTKILINEALLFTQWYLGKGNSSKLSKQFISLLHLLIQKMEQTNPTIVLRDYHAENLIWISNRKGFRKVGLLDYQDALIGHPAYDLASLLKDARRDVSINLRDKIMQHYLDQTKYDKTKFKRDYSILSAQRNLKIIGIFARLSLRDNKKHYLSLIPRVWKNLENDFLHPDLKDLSSFVLENAPHPKVDFLKTLSP